MRSVDEVNSTAIGKANTIGKISCNPASVFEVR